MTTLDRPTAQVYLVDERDSLHNEIRTAAMVWRRELIRFTRTRSRILSGFVQPILFLFVLGYGLSPLVGTTAGFDFTKFVFPGVVAMSVVTTSIFSAMSIVWDREFGFLREMLVAPVNRTGDRARQDRRRCQHRHRAGHDHADPRAACRRQSDARWSSCR